MRTRHIATLPSAGGSACIVLLPGAYHGPEDFLRAGFDRAIAERRLALELVLIAPELRHLSDRDWLGELPDRVLRPVRPAAYCGSAASRWADSWPCVAPRNTRSWSMACA
jgi:hypothetical protein